VFILLYRSGGTVCEIGWQTLSVTRFKRSNSFGRRTGQQCGEVFAAGNMSTVVQREQIAVRSCFYFLLKGRLPISQIMHRMY